MLEAEYRQLTSLGAFQVHGYLTYGSRLALDPLAPPQRRPATRASAPISRATAGFMLSPTWSITASGRYATDRTFMRRYDISRDDRLRSFVDAERITADSYISIAGWAFEGLRITDVDGMQPIALPAIDARWRIADPIARRPDRAAGQQPRHPPHRRPGQPARLRQRALGPARRSRRSARSWC